MMGKNDNDESQVMNLGAFNDDMDSEADKDSFIQRQGRGIVINQVD